MLCRVKARAAGYFSAKSRKIFLPVASARGKSWKNFTRQMGRRPNVLSAFRNRSIFVRCKTSGREEAPNASRGVCAHDVS